MTTPITKASVLGVVMVFNNNFAGPVSFSRRSYTHAIILSDPYIKILEMISMIFPTKRVKPDMKCVLAGSL